MRKFGLLSFALAVILVLSMVFVACNGDTVSAHDHVWDDGAVTVEPTCHSEGLRTYSCTVEGCTQTKTEPIAMTKHNWDEGTITEPSTCQTPGTKTYACQNEGCTATKTETLQKSSHNWDEGVLTTVPDFYTPGSKEYTCLTDGCGETRTESVGAHADFAEQYYFSLSDANNWSYGYVAEFGADPTTYTFTQITQIDDQSNAWKADGVEIGKGYVLSEKNAAVMYTFNEVVEKGIQADVAISFVGEDSATNVKGYLFITHEDEITRVELNQGGQKDWEYASQEAYDLAQGDTFAVVFVNAGTGKAGGEFSFTLTAPCNHVWGKETVLVAPKCEAPGTNQYTCLNCGETKKEETDPIGHNWDQGEVTKPASETEKGVKTFHCLNGCGQTKTEDIPMLLPSNFESANLKEDFGNILSGENVAWQIGVVDFKSDAMFTFEPLTTKTEDAFTNNEPWMEIKGDWAAIGGTAGIAYTFGADVKVDLHFSFTRNGDADFAIRWAVKNASGAIISNDGNATWGGKTSETGGTVTIDQTIDFHAGETIYIIINHESGSDQCSYTYTLTKHSGEPVVPFEGANLAEDFASVLSGENVAWQIGVVDFKSDAEFTFTALTTKSTDAFTNGDPYMEIKGDWAAIGGTAGIAYTFGADVKVDVHFSFTRNNDADFAIRWAVKNAGGAIVSNDGNATWGGKTSETGGTVTIDQTIDFHAGETIYIIINHEPGDNNQCTYTYTLTKKGGEPVVPGTEFDGAVLADDFASVLSGENVAWQIGVVDFKSDAEFTFTALTTKSADAFKNEEPWIEFKGDWAAIGGTAGIAYTFGADVKVDLHFSFTRNNDADFAIRWAVKNSDGVIVSNGGNATWGGKTSETGGTVTIDQTIDFHAGETIYIIINHESGGDQCTYAYTLTKHVEAFADFAKDLSDTLAGEDNGWSVGNVEYHFGPESFEYFETERKNGGNDGFNNVDGKPFFEIKGDWAAIGEWATIAYTFKEAGKVHFKFDITGLNGAKFSVRYAVKSASGEVKTAPVLAGNDTHVAAETDITVEEGDILYIIINHEEGGEANQCNFSFELN